MASGIKFSVRGSGDAKGRLVQLQKLKGIYTKVGVLGDAKHEGINAVQLAVIHEYGAPAAGIPARSFIGSTLAANSNYRTQIFEVVSRILAARLSATRALGLLGLKVKGDIQKRIAAGAIKQDLAPATMARKLAKGRRGSSGTPKALIESGQLRRNITHVVVGRDVEVKK